MAPTDVPKKERSLSYRLHDALNVPLVGGLAIMCILGLLGLMDAHLITKIFISYIAVDTIWIVLSPSAVPRFAWAIVLHHVLTFLILLHPLRFPEHAIETCRDVSTECGTQSVCQNHSTENVSTFHGIEQIHQRRSHDEYDCRENLCACTDTGREHHFRFGITKHVRVYEFPTRLVILPSDK